MLFANVLEPRSPTWAMRSATLLLCSIAVPHAGRAQVRELQIAPAQVQVQPGERKSVLVTAFDAVGNVVTDAEFTWSVDESIVRVTRDQTAPNILYIEGVARGRTRMTVMSNGISSTADLTVSGTDLTAIPVGSGAAAVLRIEPETIDLLPTEEVQLRPVFLREDGEPAARTPVVWRSLLETVSTVNEAGLVVGISPGQGVVEAEASTGVVGRALVRVANAPLAFAVSGLSLAPLESDTLQVVVTSQGNRTVQNRQLRWGSSDPTVVNVSPLGVVSAIRAGVANIVIRGYGQQHELPITVHRPVTSMDISPPRGDITLPLGGSMDFEASLVAEDGSTVSEAPVRWENTDHDVIAFDEATGRVTGLAEGVATLRAIGPAPGLEAAWSITVVSGGIEIDYAPTVLSKGRRVAVPVWILDTTGNRMLHAADLTWSSNDSSVAVVTDSVLHAVGWGSTHVIAATRWGSLDSIRVTVQGELLVSATRSGKADLYSLEPSAVADMNPVTADAGAELAGRYSPDGWRIAYAATGQSNNTDLFIIDADGANPRRLTATDGDEGYPGWLADGRIAYQFAQSGVTQIWVIDTTGANPQQVTAERQSSDQPDVSPDGTRIAFRRDDQIHVIGPDGSVVQVTDQGRYRNPRWYPDGSLGYIAERRIDRATVRVIVKHDLENNTATDLSPPEWPITDWAVARDGETYAVVVQQTINDVLTQGMWVVRLAPGAVGEPVELPRTEGMQQFLFPAFRW